MSNRVTLAYSLDPDSPEAAAFRRAAGHTVKLDVCGQPAGQAVVRTARTRGDEFYLDLEVPESAVRLLGKRTGDAYSLG